MKAILVIDIEADELPNDAYANVYVFGKYYEEQEEDFVACIGDVPLKPMPEYQQYRHSAGSFTRGFTKGWNNCIKEIENESNISSRYAE